VAHEVLDLGVLIGKVIEPAFCLIVAEGCDVRVLDVVADGVANRVNPSDLAAKHLGKLVGLGS
jgi:hypothetical protein